MRALPALRMTDDTSDYVSLDLKKKKERNSASSQFLFFIANTGCDETGQTGRKAVRGG